MNSLSNSEWIPISYDHYWDHARHFSVFIDDTWYVFDSYYDENTDEYTNYFDVYRCRNGAGDGFSALKVRASDMDKIGKVDIKSVVFDESRKRFVFFKIIGLIKYLESG